MFLPDHFASWEVLVVDDGGGDFDAFDQRRPHRNGAVELIRLPKNRGKGAAVRAGMLAARGRVRLFTDVDLPFGLDAIPVAATYLLDRGFHLAVGDRTLPQSNYTHNVGWRRRLASGVLAQFVSAFLTGGFFDTQCGFKAFRGDVAEALCPLLHVDRYAFDVELIYVALCHRADIKRIPVVLRNNETTAVRLVRDSMQTLADLARIRLYAVRGGYRSEALASVVARDYDDTRALADAVVRQPTPLALADRHATQ